MSILDTPDSDIDSGYDHSPKICMCCPTAGPKVGTRGKWDSPIVIVGESPGPQEVKQRKPFVGNGGQLIEQSWPKDLGFDFEDCFFTTAMQCFSHGKDKDDSKRLKAAHCCQSRLFEQIGLAPRKMILAFGKYAGISLLRDDNFKVMSQRGVVRDIIHPGREGESTKLVHVLHPAFLLRGMGSLGHFKQDIRRGVEIALGSQGRKYNDPDYHQLSSASQVQELIDYIREIHVATKERVKAGTDIETTGFSWFRDRILCIGIFIHGIDKETDNIGYVIDWDRILLEWKAAGINIEGVNGARCVRGKEIPDPCAASPLYAKTKELLEMPEIDFIWQNGKFDIKFLVFENIRTRIDDDTFLCSYTLDERPGNHGLEEIAKNRLGAPEYKDEIQKYLPKKGASYEYVPKPVLWKYLARDVKNTHDAFISLRADVAADQHCEKLYTRSLLPYVGMLSRLELRGFYVDIAHVQDNDTYLLNEIELAQARVSEAAGEFINPNSPQQVAAYLFDKVGMKLKGKRPEGTAKEILDKLYEENQHPVLKAIRDYRKVVKAHSTYIKAVFKFIAADGRVHSTYNPCGSTTGRLASSEPNLQNIPRDPRIRRMYRSSQDFDHPRILVEGDYNTAELRGLAALSKDPTLTEIFLDDKRNLHDEVSVEMYGPDFTGDQRIRAKAINFGIPYGREAFSIAEEFNITPSEAQRLIDRWFATFPGARDFINKCREAPTNGQTLVTAFGRKRRPGVVSDEILKGLKNEFANYFMQSTINDFTLQSACEMEYELERLDSFFVNLIHDAVIVDAPRAAYKEVKALIQKYMEHVPTKWITTPIAFKADIKAGTHWGELVKEEKFETALLEGKFND